MYGYTILEKKESHDLFELEEENNIPNEERLTYDQNKKHPEYKFDYPRPEKKAYVDIRVVINSVDVLKEKGKYPWSK